MKHGTWRGIKRRVGKLLRALVYLSILYALVVALAIWQSGDDNYQVRLHDHVVNDVTELNPVPMSSVIAPRSVEEIVIAIKTSSGPISIGGGRFSMGGQTAIDNGLQLDMRDYDQVVAFSPERREITVQSGMSWRELQEYIDPHDLSVKIMQTYANFSVGGSVSVNVHGRYIGHGPIISSIKNIQLVLADGRVVNASREENPSLFFAAIGGYGGIGVITEVTLELAVNEKVGRQTKTMPISKYREHFARNIRDNEKIVFHNADIYPPDFETVRDVSWYITDEPVTVEQRLIEAHGDYPLLPRLIEFTSSGAFGKWLRSAVFDPVYYIPDRVAWRNWEASYDVRELGDGDRSKRTWVLQEYFVPVDRFDNFVPKMRAIFKKHDVDVVNISIRHALPDPDSYLSWARSEVFAFVVYHSQGTTDEDKAKVGVWTREMTDAILSENGAYYLPYQPHATNDQFLAAYPDSGKYFAVKKAVDPDNRFQNKLWEKYYPTRQSKIRDYLDGLDGYKKGEEQTFLSLPEWYLVFNPNEYADFLERGNNPSDFPFFSSIDEYWSLFDRVNVLTHGLYPENSEYQLMLWIIGVSTTGEFVAKGAYEGTVGRFTRWTASGDTPEDVLIQQAHRAYGNLIYVEPWYNFPFWKHARLIWTETPFFGQNFIRKLERKLMFTAEFGFKGIYASLVGFGAKTAYEESDGLVTMHIIADADILTAVDPRIRVLKDMGEGDLVITLPRWGEFTEIVPKLAKTGARFVEISGNDEILITTVDPGDQSDKLEKARFLFHSTVISPENRQRSVYLVRVEDLPNVLDSLEARGSTLEHIFDY
jgi:FAD/FMN-containing dehydrogenase